MRGLREWSYNGFMASAFWSLYGDGALLGGPHSDYIQIVEMVSWLSMIAFINVM